MTVKFYEKNIDIHNVLCARFTNFLYVFYIFNLSMIFVCDPDRRTEILPIVNKMLVNFGSEK